MLKVIRKKRRSYSCGKVFMLSLLVTVRVEEGVTGGHLSRYVQLTQNVGHFLGHMAAHFSLVVKLRLS